MSNILAERLKEKRKKYKFTQQEIADKIGVTQSTYAYYESGRNEPDVKILMKLADLYETSIDYLTGRYN